MSFIYFLQAENGPIKIGMATNLDRRIYGLQTAHFHRLKLIHSEEHDDLIVRKKERHYHDIFSHYRIRGEWFQPHGIIAYLEGETFWHKMIVWEPELKNIYEEAKQSTPRESWAHDYKARFKYFVGFMRKLPPRELQTCEAYEIAYRKINEAFESHI